MENNEIMKEKEKSRILECEIKTLGRQLMETEKHLIKKLSKSPVDEAIEKTKQEFKAKINLTSSILAEEKQRNRTLVKCLMRKDRQVNKLLKKQARSRSKLSQPKRDAEVVKKSLEPRGSDWRQLKRGSTSLNYQIKTQTENKQKEQDHINKVTNHGLKMRKLYIRTEQEDLKASINSTKADIAVEGPKDETNNKEIKFLPSIDEQLPKTKSDYNQKTLRPGEGKLEPNSTNNLTSERQQLKPKPPSQKKPVMPPFTPAVRKFFLREIERRKNSSQPEGNAKVDENSKDPS